MSDRRLVWALLLTACGGRPGADGAGRGLLYGADTRRQPHEVQDPALRGPLERAVALFTPEGLPGPWARLGDRRPFCTGERYLEEPAASRCSGVLLDDRRVLTAGHCVEEGTTPVVARGYQVDAQGRPPAPETLALLSVETVEARRVDPPGTPGGLDYAVLRLAAAVPGLEPAASGAPPGEGAPLWAVGHPAGLPLKVDDGGWVEAVDAAGFRAALDLYQGSSGSGVYGAGGVLLGIAIGGRGDYLFDLEDRCFRSLTSSAGQERVLALEAALADRRVEPPAPEGCRAAGAPELALLLLLAPLAARRVR